MNRADLACAWGNTLLPYFLGGDPKQLPPTILTGRETDSNGNFIHCFVRDGRISPLEFFQLNRMPVYRLRVQLRMTKGLFDIVAKHFYVDLGTTYGPGCDISLPKFEIGRRLEAFAQHRFRDIGFEPSVEGRLSPLFIHCEGSFVYQDPITRTMTSYDQVEVAIKFAADFIKATKADASKITFLAPYSTNVNLIESMKKQPEYHHYLHETLKTSTVEGFQGQENDIIIIVMGTNYHTLPGFTSDEQRLNVLLTRARCGLVIVGDINSAHDVKKLVKGDVGKPMRIETPEGDVIKTKALVLQAIHADFWKSKRVAEVVVERQDGKK